jgi:hypothetical protein
MVNEKAALLKVRNLFNGRPDVDRTESDAEEQGAESSWIQDSTGRITDESIDDPRDNWVEDNTGRVTDESKDDPDVIQDDGHGEGFLVHTEQVGIPNNHPAIQFAETNPHYPIVYSCEHVLLLPQEGEEMPMTDKKYDFFAPPPEVGPHLNDTSVPIILQLLLPQSIDGEALNTDQMKQNVDAMEWSLLNLIAESTGLSKNCNISMQYNHKRSLLHQSLPLHRQLEQHLESLPYPTGIYEVATDRESTKWKSM